MAIIHSGNNAFLFNNLRISKYAFVVWALILIVIAIVIATRTPLQALTLSILIIVPLLFAYKQLKTEGINMLSFGNGLTGEKEILKELEKLPDEYNIFCNVKLPGNKYDIDFVVIGLNAIYTVETKSHIGEITYENGMLMKNGKQFEKKVREQAWHQSNNLRNYFVQNKIIVSPIPVLIFSRAHLKFGLEPINNVYVINKQYLPKLFQKFEGTQKLDHRNEIIKLLISINNA